jgi:hypothetical protein
MSTYLYLTCQCHEPTLLADEESSQHAHRDIDKVRGWVADRDALLRAFRENYDLGEYFLNNTMRFLAQHSDCVIGARDEYGENWPITTPTEGEPK